MKLRSVFAGAGLSLASVGAFAADYTTEIGSAVTDASGNQTAVVAGVITIAVIGFGVAALLRFLNR